MSNLYQLSNYLPLMQCRQVVRPKVDNPSPGLDRVKTPPPAPKQGAGLATSIRRLTGQVEEGLDYAIIDEVACWP